MSNYVVKSDTVVCAAYQKRHEKASLKLLQSLLPGCVNAEQLRKVAFEESLGDSQACARVVRELGIVEHMDSCLSGRFNLLVHLSGATNSGKTTLRKQLIQGMVEELLTRIRKDNNLANKNDADDRLTISTDILELGGIRKALKEHHIICHNEKDNTFQVRVRERADGGHQTSEVLIASDFKNYLCKVSRQIEQVSDFHAKTTENHSSSRAMVMHTIKATVKALDDKEASTHVQTLCFRLVDYVGNEPSKVSDRSLEFNQL